MKAVVQRVSKASVKINGKIHGEISKGLLVLLGVKHGDDDNIVKWFANKLLNLRVFPDDEGKMNRSVLDIDGGILLISNFTIYGDTRKGYRPSFSKAAPPEQSEPVYQKLLDTLREVSDLKIEAGVFGAMMDVELVNDGPVTVIIEKE
jgi:D-tyrosyl-tRNA(Tyr) deacylase